jgi:hypothetical protein
VKHCHSTENQSLLLQLFYLVDSSQIALSVKKHRTLHPLQEDDFDKPFVVAPRILGGIKKKQAIARSCLKSLVKIKN